MSDSMTRDDVLSALGEISQHFENCAEATYGGSHGRFHRWMNAADWAAAYLNDPAPTVATDTNVLGKWISVKDRLPKEEGAYLVAFKPPLTKVTIAWWATREYGWYDLEYNFHTDSVSHWMPLPESPEEVSEDEG